MKLEIFSVYDQKAGAYINPFFLPNKELAERAFTDCINDPSHQFGRNPSDYILFQLGEFDALKGTFETAAPLAIGVGIEYQCNSPILDLSGIDPANVADLKLAILKAMKEVKETTFAEPGVKYNPDTNKDERIEQ